VFFLVLVGVYGLAYLLGHLASDSTPPPKLAIKCPNCMHRTVETARKFVVVRGMLIVFRYGSISLVGCRQCVSEQGRSVAGGNLFLGWWSIFGFLATPFVLLQNVYNLSGRPNSRMLREVLAEVGYSLEDASVGNDGLSGEQRRLLRAAAAALKSIALVEGTSTAEWHQARDHLTALSDGSLTPSGADQLLRTVRPEELDKKHFDVEQRHVLLRIAIDVASADGNVSAREEEALCYLGERLGFTRSFVRQFLASPGGPAATTSSGVAAARMVLGVSEDAGIGEIRSAYKRLMMQHHPDRVAPDEREEANRKAAEINAAYDLLLGRVSASDGSTEQQQRPRPPPRPPTKSQEKAPPQPPKAKRPTLCRACQRRVSETARFCGFCGTKDPVL